MAKEERIVGPPGAGKTTTVRNRVAKFVADGEYEPENIVLTSFSRAAAKELAGAVAVPQENVATLHSLARRIIGPAPIAEVGKLAKQWDESGIPVAWKIGGRTTADLEDGLAADSGDGSMLASYSLMRSRMLPAEHPSWEMMMPFAARWEQFKKETGSVDFTDMIYYAIAEGGPCYGEPPVIMVDEAQDLNPLQWMLVRHWAEHPSVERFFVMGDPAQAIFAFAGARPEELLTPLPGDQQYVLPHSYRMPRLIKDHAERYLAHHSGSLSEGRVYTPRFDDDDKTVVAEGIVRRSSATWRTPDMVVAEMERLAAAGRSSLVLTTCSYMLEPTITMLRERGLIYQNQWRRSNGRWNPIGAKRDDQTRTADRVAAFHRGEAPELWVPMLAADTFHTRGGKKHLEDNPAEWAQWTKTEALAAIDRHDLRWLLAHVNREYQRPVEYAAKVIARRGPEILDAKVLVDIGTIHSVKGGAADVVFIFPDVSAAGAEEIFRGQTGRDSAIRLGYVAASRAREELVLCAPAGRDELGL